MSTGFMDDPCKSCGRSILCRAASWISTLIRSVVSSMHDVSLLLKIVVSLESGRASMEAVYICYPKHCSNSALATITLFSITPISVWPMPLSYTDPMRQPQVGSVGNFIFFVVHYLLFLLFNSAAVCWSNHLPFMASSCRKLWFRLRVFVSSRQ